MGSGSYSTDTRYTRSVEMGFMSKGNDEIFTNRSLPSAMNPYGLKLRESRDSAEHPNSLAIIIALDVTGSMGSIPQHLVRNGLPTIMESIIKQGIKDPQVMFLGIGDHYFDKAPIQVTQFESSDEKLDHWLTETYIEGGGGGNSGESYLLAWYVAGHKTDIDCYEKRGNKGFLFTIGDEPNLDSISGDAIKKIFGSSQVPARYTASELLNKAQDCYEVYHLHIQEGSNGRRADVVSGWREALGDHLLVVQNHTLVAEVIASVIIDKCKEPILNLTTGKLETRVSLAEMVDANPNVLVVRPARVDDSKEVNDVIADLVDRFPPGTISTPGAIRIDDPAEGLL